MSKIFHHLSYVKDFGGYGQIVFEDKASCSEDICPHDVNYCLNFAV